MLTTLLSCGVGLTRITKCSFINSVQYYCHHKPKMKLLEKEILIPVPWGKVAALTWGDAKYQPVLLCHGRMHTASIFRRLLRLLPQNFFYVGIELPGHGKSDIFPKGGRFTIPDYVPVISSVREHFKWDTFIYIGHSLGSAIGKYYNIAYPNILTKMVELDPLPAHETWSPETFANWLQKFYGDFYSPERYKKVNASSDTAPKYTYEKVMEMIMKTQELPREAAEDLMERTLEPAGDGLFRFNYDQRVKEIPRLPLDPEFLRKIYTSVKTPTYCVIAEDVLNEGAYDLVPFIKDEKAWPNKNYKYIIVKGGHNVHISNPELFATELGRFLTDGKAKL